MIQVFQKLGLENYAIVFNGKTLAAIPIKLRSRSTYS
jgi:hypothetical protein